MGNLRFMIMVRREGESVHDSDKFSTEDYNDRDDLIDAVAHYINVQLEDEEVNGEEYIARNTEGRDDN